MRATINAMRDVSTMQLVPPAADQDIVVTADGTLYTLEAPGRDESGQKGILSIRSNVRMPLATWAERMQSSIAGCWSDKSPSA